MEQNVIDKLYENLEVALKPGQGFKYVKTRYVLDRLNKAFQNNWGSIVKEHKIIDDEVLVLVSLFVYDNNGNILATQDGFGSAKKFKNVDLGNLYKSATSRAIKSAARNWGVGLFLEEEDNADTGISESYSSNNTLSVPSSLPISSMPSVPSMPSTGTPNFTSTPSTGLPNHTSMPSTTATVTTGVPDSKPKMPKNTTPSKVSEVVEKPKGFPSVSTVLGTPPMMPTKGSGEGNLLTMVQKVAITSRLSSKNLQFEDVAKEFYAARDSEAPESLEGMLYSDALDMVTFLSSK